MFPLVAPHARPGDPRQRAQSLHVHASPQLTSGALSLSHVAAQAFEPHSSFEPLHASGSASQLSVHGPLAHFVLTWSHAFWPEQTTSHGKSSGQLIVA
jgi:hypothetical protein